MLEITPAQSAALVAMLLSPAREGEDTESWIARQAGNGNLSLEDAFELRKYLMEKTG